MVEATIASPNPGRHAVDDARPVDPGSDGSRPRFDLDALIEDDLRRSLAALDGTAPLLAKMARYHLGASDQTQLPMSPGLVDRGKRMRPAVAILSAGAVSAERAEAAAPVAAAIELLHNFTLIHDDVQDESPTRRHRPTVWSLWGIGQAINAGDALFAASHLPFFRLAERGVDSSLVLRLLEAFDRTAITIVEGQTLDLGFEGRRNVSPDDYLRMIAGKTAAIVRYAAWAGALLGGADDETADRFAAFGLALGLGFQVRDDLLGTWGAASTTGKAAADDIRRRKQSLPILILRERCDAAGRSELDARYGAPSVGPDGVASILAMLAAGGIRAEVEQRVAAYHDQAREALLAATGDGDRCNPSRDHLLALVDRLASRDG